MQVLEAGVSPYVHNVHIRLIVRPLEMDPIGSKGGVRIGRELKRKGGGEGVNSDKLENLGQQFNLQGKIHQPKRDRPVAGHRARHTTGGGSTRGGLR